MLSSWPVRWGRPHGMVRRQAWGTGPWPSRPGPRGLGVASALLAARPGCPRWFALPPFVHLTGLVVWWSLGGQAGALSFHWLCLRGAWLAGPGVTTVPENFILGVDTVCPHRALSAGRRDGRGRGRQDLPRGMSPGTRSPAPTRNKVVGWRMKVIPSALHAPWSVLRRPAAEGSRGALSRPRAVLLRGIASLLTEHGP